MSGMKRQHGVQIVWADPVDAGAVKRAEDYVPDWHWFDDPAHAESHARHYRTTVGDLMPHLWPGADPDEMWMDRAVAEVNRAERWAVEEYGEPEDVRPHLGAP